MICRKEFISSCWQTRVICCPMYILTKKLKLLKDRLKIWNKNVFGNVHQFLREAEQTLHHIQYQIQMTNPSDSLRNREKMAQCGLDKALEGHACFWHEKSSLSSLLERDRNTAFFHRITKIKN